MTSTPK